MNSDRRSFTVEDERPLQSTDGALESPLSAGRYALLSVLGQGGMATVFLARKRDEPADKFFVVKRLHAHLSADRRAVDGLKHEALLGKLLGAPGVAHVHELKENEPRPLLVSEHLRGVTLDHLLGTAASAPLPRELGFFVLCEVLSVLDRAHNLKDAAGKWLEVVHCDVSPQNIFVSWDGRISLLDFGIARLSGASRNTTGVIRGKIAYVSPEQALGRTPDRRADVWAVGAIAWEIVAKRPRIEQEDFSALAASINSEIVDVREHQPDAPLPLAELINETLERNFEARLKSAEDFRTKLEPFAAPDGKQALTSFLNQHYAERKAAEEALLARLRAVPLTRLRRGKIRMAAVGISALAVLGLSAAQFQRESTPEAIEAATSSEEISQEDPSQGDLPSASGEKDDTPEPSRPNLTPKGETPATEGPLGAPPLQKTKESTTRAGQTPEMQPAYGAVTLMSKPWAQVSQGGRIVGTTPLVNYRLPVGRHLLVLESPATGKTKSITVDITSDTTTTHRVELE